jgi:hydroxypyruvate isomerase
MLRFSANLSTLFQELPLASRFEAAAKAGFDAVELWFPYEIPAPQMRTLLEAHGLRCVGINSPAGDIQRGDWGLAADPTRREAFDASVEQAFDYAQAIGCANVHVMAGQIEAGAPWQPAWDHYLQCMGAAADRAAARNLTVMIEPLNRLDRPRYLLNTQAQALEALATLNRPNLKIMLDVYHLQRGEGNLIERLRASLPHAAHVQIADNPGRHEPGTGEIRFDTVFAEIERSGYAGTIGCEYLPSGSTAESFGWLETMRAAQAV